MMIMNQAMIERVQERFDFAEIRIPGGLLPVGHYVIDRATGAEIGAGFTSFDAAEAFAAGFLEVGGTGPTGRADTV